MQKLSIPNPSRIGRLKKIPNFKSNSIQFKARHITSGRLLADTFLTAREVMRETDYSLGNFAF